MTLEEAVEFFKKEYAAKDALKMNEYCDCHTKCPKCGKKFKQIFGEFQYWSPAWYTQTIW